jgi:uncharacterized cofD-like protein
MPQKRTPRSKTRLPSKKSGEKRVVVIGGGTGTYAVLSALKPYPLALSAIVTMADDGGSTGVLRDEFGVLPPGDLRQCLVALSEAPDVMRRLFMHRFDRGGLKGHSFGNLFLSTLEQVTGNLDSAIDVVGEVLKIRGKVIPVTLSSVKLVAKLQNGKVLEGEMALTAYQLLSRFGIEEIYLTPKPKANPKAIQAILEADVVIVGPGSMYSSLIPNFLVPGIGKALQKTKAKKVFIVNLMNKHGHTDHFHVADHVSVLEEKIGDRVFDTVLYNTKIPEKALLRSYADEGDPVPFVKDRRLKGRTVVGRDILSSEIGKAKKGDMIYRTLIRHDQKKLGKTIMDII